MNFLPGPFCAALELISVSGRPPRTHSGLTAAVRCGEGKLNPLTGLERASIAQRASRRQRTSALNRLTKGQREKAAGLPRTGGSANLSGLVETGPTARGSRVPAASASVETVRIERLGWRRLGRLADDVGASRYRVTDRCRGLRDIPPELQVGGDER